MDPAQNEIIRIVSVHLDRHKPVGYRLVVPKDGARRDNGWWHVAVLPEGDDVPLLDYAHLLTEIEDEIQAETGKKVLLVSSLVDD